MKSKDPSERQGFRNAQRLGLKIIEERIASVDMLIDRKGSNGWIETYSRLFDMPRNKSNALGEMAYYHEYCDYVDPPEPVKISLLTRAWFYVWYGIAYKFYVMSRKFNRGYLKATTSPSLKCN